MIDNDIAPEDFGNSLKNLIDHDGGLTVANLQRIAERGREVTPDFSLQRLRTLLLGVPANEGDRRAISHALVPPEDQWLCEHFSLEDGKSRRIAKSADQYAKPFLRSAPSCRRFAIGFVQSDMGYSSFRDQSLGQEDLSQSMCEYWFMAQYADEFELFELHRDSQ